MGENEQGGMLRVVVVLGLISIIGFAVISLVMSASADSKKQITTSEQTIKNRLGDKGVVYDQLNWKAGSIDSVSSRDASYSFENVGFGYSRINSYKSDLTMAKAGDKEVIKFTVHKLTDDEMQLALTASYLNSSDHLLYINTISKGDVRIIGPDGSQRDVTHISSAVQSQLSLYPTTFDITDPGDYQVRLIRSFTGDQTVQDRTNAPDLSISSDLEVESWMPGLLPNSSPDVSWYPNNYLGHDFVSYGYISNIETALIPKGTSVPDGLLDN